MMAEARINLPPGLDRIHLFQLEDCIIQSNLGEQDREMVRMYLIDKIPQIEIAAEFGCSRTTVHKHLKKAIAKIACTNQRLYKRIE